jgi:flagellar basal body-associated protein FliL
MRAGRKIQMFQFNPKTSFSDPNPTNVNLNTALPNSHGKVRTLKEDYEDLKKGKLKKEQEFLSEEIAGVKPLAPTPIPEIAPISRPVSQPPKAPEQAAFLTPKENEKQEEQKEISNPFGSQSFFNGKSPFEEGSQPSSPQTKDEAAPKIKSQKNLIIIISSLLALVILGGGFYYYWFFIKKSPAQNNIPPTAQTKPAQSPNIQPENKNLRSLNIDASLGKEANQKALQTFAENFLSGAAENDLVEVKVMDKNNQPATPKDLEASLGFFLPDKLSENITSDYSLFIKKENSKAHIGAAFKVSDTLGLFDELLQQEKNLPTQLLPFFLKEAPMATVTSFSPGKYKNADIRYFNFPDIPGTSLDYSILTDKQNGYFVFATSREALRSILDFMWGK